MRACCLVLAATFLAGCGGSNKSEPEARGCTSLTAQDITTTTGISARQRDLNPDPGVQCSTVYAAGPSEIVVAITETTGDGDALKSLRAAKVAQYGRGSVRAFPGLGEGAFVAAGRMLALRRGSTIFVLETGYRPSGGLVVEISKLAQLARIAADQSE